MSQEDVRSMVDRAIREHELRVAFWSGLAGALLMGGTWHAIWLCR
jgi:putative hemolysin